MTEETMAEVVLKREKGDLVRNIDVHYYVPVYQSNFDDGGNVIRHPGFQWYMSEASQDEQMAWSFKPDYVLELTGTLKAKIKDLVFTEEETNDKRRVRKQSYVSPEAGILFKQRSDERYEEVFRRGL